MNTRNAWFLVSISLSLFIGGFFVSTIPGDRMLALVTGLSGGLSKPAASATCALVSKDLVPGARDTATSKDIENLQKALASDKMIYPEQTITGYYGPATERAVKRFKEANKLYDAKLGPATATGLVDASMRTIINSKFCSVITPSKSPFDSTSNPFATNNNPLGSVTAGKSSTTSSVLSLGSLGAKSSDPKLAPKISMIEGPSMINPGIIGTWTIKAESPTGSPLKYGASFERGSGTANATVAPVSDSAQPSFSYLFKKSGVYEILFSATDKSGKKAVRSFVLSVGGAQRKPYTVKVTLRNAALYPKCTHTNLTCDYVRGGYMEAYRLLSQDDILIGEYYLQTGIGYVSNVVAGSHLLKISAAGFEPIQKVFTLVENTNPELVIWMTTVDKEKKVPGPYQISPTVGYIGEVLRVTGSNLNVGNEVRFDGDLAGNLKYDAKGYYINIPLELTPASSCSVKVRKCDGKPTKTVERDYQVMLVGPYGEGEKVKIKVFKPVEKYKTTPSSGNTIIVQ